MDKTPVEHIRTFCLYVEATGDRDNPASGAAKIDYTVRFHYNMICQVLLGEKTYNPEILIHFNCCLWRILNADWIWLGTRQAIAYRAVQCLGFEVKKYTLALNGPGISENEMKKLSQMKSALDNLAKWAKTELPPLFQRNWDAFYKLFLTADPLSRKGS